MSHITLPLSRKSRQYRTIILAFVAALAVAVVLTIALASGSSHTTASQPAPVSQNVNGVRYDGAPQGHPRIGSASAGEGTPAPAPQPNSIGQRP